MAALLHDLPWCDQSKYEQAEVVLVKSCCVPASKPRESPISASFAMISADIESSLQTSSTISKQPAVAVKTDSMSSSDATRIKSLEEDNQTLHRTIQELTDRITKLEAHCFSGAGQQSQVTVAKEPVAREQAGEDDDDDVDLFGSDDDDDDEFEKLKAKRIAEYEAKKAKKPATVAKSNLILDVKPWDDETDMNEIEKAVRSIEADGLVWGASKLVPLAYGIKKLQITCVVEDDKIGTDFLEESITAFEDLIQSMDVVAFNKI